MLTEGETGMFKMNAFAAVIMSALLVDGAMAAEFAKEMSPTTVELQQASVEKKVTSASSVPASKLAENWLRDCKKTPGYRNGVFIAVGSFQQAANPFNMTDVRALCNSAAQLNAKAKIAQFLNTKASASIRHTIPPKSTEMTEYDKAKAELNKQLNALLGDYHDALSAVDAEKANQLAGISMDELYMAGLAATLQKYGISLDIQGLKAESKRKLEDLQNRVKNLETQLEGIKLQAETLANSLNNEQASETQLISQMLLSGAVVVNSWESFIGGKLEVAVVVVWSPAQERFIRSVLGIDTEPVKLSTKSKKSFEDYVYGVDWERVAGTRWFVDSDGTPHLFGVGIEEIRDQNSSTLEIAKGMAESDAWKNLALALYGDVKAQSIAKRKVQNVRNEKGNDEVHSVSGLARDVQNAVKDLTVVGVSTVSEGVRPSPITNRDVYVTVVHVDPLSVRDGHEMRNRQFDIARDIGKAQQELKGNIDQNFANVKSAHNDAESYARGVDQANAQAAERKNTEQNIGNGGRDGSRISSSGNTRMREGSFGGAGAEDFSF